jgi:hypothetical protein
VSEYTIKPLNTETWDAYAQILDKHKGGFEFERPKGKNTCVVRKVIPAS